MNKLSNYGAISVSEYADGTVGVNYVRLDQGTRRVFVERVGALEQPLGDPMTVPELLVWGSAELLALKSPDLFGIV